MSPQPQRTTRIIKRFNIQLSETARRRERFVKEKGKITEFIVQLEIRIGDEWRPVIRYDSAHGFAHRDRYTLEGESWKEPLPWTYEEALTRAEADLAENWEKYQQDFLGGEDR